MIYLLLIGLILELVCCYIIFEKDLFSPSAVLCEVFILSTVACIFRADDWGVNLGTDTLATIIIGNAIFIAVSAVIHRFFRKRCVGKKDNRREKLSYINIRSAILILVTIAYVIFAMVYARHVISILHSLDQSGGMTHAMSMYRGRSFSGEISLPDWLTRLNVIFGIGIYVIMYIFINNLIVDRKRKSNYLLLIAIVAYLVSSVFTTQRTTILLAFMYALFVTYTLLNRKYRFVERLNKKYIFRGAIALVVFLVLFGATRGIFGREGEVTLYEDVTHYMGNSIESLDLYIKYPLEKQQFGEETFRQFRNYLSKYDLAEESVMENANLEFRIDAKGNRAGNVYTGYRFYIHDFGYVSIIFIQIFLALFFGIWYEKLNYRQLKTNVDLSFVLFAWFMLTIFRFSITESFFNWLAAFVFTYWYVFLLWKILFNLKISSGRKNNLRQQNTSSIKGLELTRGCNQGDSVVLKEGVVYD